MKLHRNAKSPPSSRLLLVRRLLHQDWSYPSAAAFPICHRLAVGCVKDNAFAAPNEAIRHRRCTSGIGSSGSPAYFLYKHEYGVIEPGA
jgi:hypothetical protein